MLNILLSPILAEIPTGLAFHSFFFFLLLSLGNTAQNHCNTSLSERRETHIHTKHTESTDQPSSWDKYHNEIPQNNNIIWIFFLCRQRGSSTYTYIHISISISRVNFPTTTTVAPRTAQQQKNKKKLSHCCY